MPRILSLTIAAAAAAILTVGVAAGPAAAKTCVNKAGQGTNSTDDGAKFQAWEAVLQATDWGAWASWMGSNGKIGTAPGYAVSKVSFRCKAGGIGRECVGQATLCK
jgi:hypothetical protein